MEAMQYNLVHLSVCTYVPVQAVPHFLPDAVTCPAASTSTKWQTLRLLGVRSKKGIYGQLPRDLLVSDSPCANFIIREKSPS